VGFQVGERVRVLVGQSLYGSENLPDECGTVSDTYDTEATMCEPGEVCVSLDQTHAGQERGGNYFHPEDLELLAATVPELVLTQREQLLADVSTVISGQRDVAYGKPEQNQQRIADLWSVLFGIPVTARQACIALILVKVAREVNQPKRDNLVDIAGYAAIADEVTPDGASAAA
jgi:hypothetical protein